MRDVITVDQPASLFLFTFESDKNVVIFFLKVRYLSFPIYTCVISSSLTSGEVQHTIHLVYIKKSIRGRGAADIFPLRRIRYAHALSYEGKI